MNENVFLFVCQAYATVVSAAEDKDPDSDNFGKVDEIKQYPSATLSMYMSFPSCCLHFNICLMFTSTGEFQKAKNLNTAPRRRQQQHLDSDCDEI